MCYMTIFDKIRTYNIAIKRTKEYNIYEQKIKKLIYNGGYSLKKRKFRKIICIVLAVLMGTSLLSFAIDSWLAESGKTPVLSVPYAVEGDEESSHYLGLGYQITVWKRYSKGRDVTPGIFTGVEKKYLFGINLEQEHPSVPLTQQKDSVL